MWEREDSTEIGSSGNFPFMEWETQEAWGKHLERRQAESGWFR